MGTPHSDPAVSRRAAVAGLGTIGLGLTLASYGAVAQDATPAGPTKEELLAEVTLPADVLAFETTTVVGLNISAVPAGTSVAWTGSAGGCCPAQNATYVIKGTSTFKAAVLTYLLHVGAGTTPEVAAADTEVSLGPGDAILHRDEFDWAWTVTDDGPARLLSFWMVEGSGLPSPDLASWVLEDYEFVSTDVLSSVPLTLRLRELTLDAGRLQRQERREGTGRALRRHALARRLGGRGRGSRDGGDAVRRGPRALGPCASSGDVGPGDPPLARNRPPDPETGARGVVTFNGVVLPGQRGTLPAASPRPLSVLPAEATARRDGRPRTGAGPRARVTHNVVSHACPRRRSAVSQRAG